MNKVVRREGMNKVVWAGISLLLGACSAHEGEPPLEQTERQGAQLAVNAAPTQISGFALLASGRASIQDRSIVSGGHVGIAPGTGDSITLGFDAKVALGYATLGQRAVLKERSTVGDLFANSVSGLASQYASLSPYSAPPAQPALAPFTAGTTPVTVNTPTTLAAGNYGLVTVNSTLTLSGGTYQVQNVNLGPNAVIQATSPTLLRVAGRINGNNNNRLAPTGTQPAGNLRIVVAGANDTTGGMILGNDSRLSALVLSQASFRAGDRFIGAGALAARNVTLGFDARYTFAGGFECNANGGCNDANECTTDACVDGRCTHVAVPNGTTCADEGNECTTNVCSVGVCTHPALADGTSCNTDSNECTTDVCSVGVCAHPPLANGTSCTDDANVCTTDQCVSGACAHPAVPNGTACGEDGDSCTTDECTAGSCVHPTLPGCAVIGPEGGSVEADEGRVVLTVPAGALAADTEINVTATPIEADLPYSGLLSQTLYNFEPHGLNFAVPATLTIQVDPDNVPVGVNPASLVLLSSEHGAGTELTPLTRWEERPSSVDLGTLEVTGTIEHFSHDGVGESVARIEVEPEELALIPGTTQVVNISLFDADDERLLHVIDWSDDSDMITAFTAPGIDQGQVTASNFDGLGEATVTVTVHNEDEDDDVSVEVPVRVALGTLAFENSVSSQSNDGVNDARTIGYSYSHDLGNPLFWGDLNPLVSPMTATYSALTYHGQELTIIDGPFYGYADDDLGGVATLGMFTATHGWPFIPGLRFSTMHLEPGDEESMEYNHSTGHAMRYVRGTCSRRLPWGEIFENIARAAESALICETADIAFGLLDVERRYFQAQPHFTSEVTLSELNEAPVDAGFFIEADYDARIPVIGAGVTAGVNPGYSIKRRSDGFVDVDLMYDAPNVRVINDMDVGDQRVSDLIRDKLRTQVPEAFEKVINDALVQPIPDPFAQECDPDDSDAAQECLEGVLDGLAGLCEAGISPEACIAPQVLNEGNFVCQRSGQCAVHPMVVEVNVLPEELELVFAPNPFAPTAQVDRFFRALSEFAGVELCGEDIDTDTRIDEPVADLQLGSGSIGDTPPIPCDEL